MPERKLRLISRLSLAVAVVAAIAVSLLTLKALHENNVRDTVSIRDRAQIRAQIRDGERQRAQIRAEQERLRRSMDEFLEQSRRRHDETQQMIRGLKPDTRGPQ